MYKNRENDTMHYFGSLWPRLSRKAVNAVTQYRKAIVGAGEYTVVDVTRPPEANPVHLPAGPVDPNSVVPPIQE